MDQQLIRKPMARAELPEAERKSPQKEDEVFRGVMPKTIPEIVCSFRTPRKRLSIEDVQNRLRFRQPIITSALLHHLFDVLEDYRHRVTHLECKIDRIERTVSVRDWREGRAA